MFRDSAATLPRAVLRFWWVALAGCGFSVPATPSDGGTDTTSAVVVGFSQATSIVDEQSGAIGVPVVLSAPAGDVTVEYSIVDVSTTAGADYTGATSGTLTIPAGATTASVPLEILADSADETNETFQVVLGTVTGATLGTNVHEVTISANVLPRVSVEVTVAQGDEGSDPQLRFKLDVPAPGTVTVDYAVTGTASAQDHALAAGRIELAAGETEVIRTLDVVDDSLDEDPETVVVTLANPSGALLGATGTDVTYEILDNDASPSVQFEVATQTVDESNTIVTANVTLSTASGRTVTVPVTINNPGTTAMNGNDYTLLTGSPLTFPPGTTTLPFMVMINEDMANEQDETVRLAFGALTAGVPGSPATHTITIVDDDPFCQGVGTFLVCAKAAPQTPVALPPTLDTDTSNLCANPSTLDWASGNGQGAACFIYATTITMAQDTYVTGSRPLVLVGTTISITHTLDVAAHRGTNAGAGSASAVCPAFPTAPGANAAGGGGGAGGTFLSQGGNGGGGNGATLFGTAPPPLAVPSILRAGCDGQRGAAAGANQSGAVGEGGGAVYLVASGALSISGAINASGSGGTGGNELTGGSGGGSGGMIVLHAATLGVGGAEIMAAGGGGASGGDNNEVGLSGQDPDPSAISLPAQGGPGSAGAAGGNGYGGWPLSTAAGAGASAPMNRGGGGGGGGGGYIRSNQPLVSASVVAGRIDAP